jgi:hypothetical protein
VQVPDRVTHYYLPSRRPFQNLSDLAGDEVLDVMHELNELRRAGTHKRPFGRVYIEWRRLTEERLRTLFLAAGGRPERAAPHYFCLGRSTWFEGLADGMRSVSLPLADLPPDRTSFTLADSFGAMGFGPRFGYPAAKEPHQQVVYPLAELETVLGRHPSAPAVPTEYDGFEHHLVDTYVEVQLWTDDPVRPFLTQR